MTDTEITPANPDIPAFRPVCVKARHDGWTEDRQRLFIDALAESGCVDHAARAVGMSPASAYALKRRIDAQPFRLAWEAALDFAVRRLADVALSRAINGVARPVFYKGEQVGERRYYDERLTQFILRTRDQERFGKWRESREARQHPDGPALLLGRAMNALTDWLFGWLETPDHHEQEEEEA